MLKKKWLWMTGFVAFIIIWNYPMTYHIGINGRVVEKKIPFYAKASGFLYRDWMYKDIVNDIIVNKDEDDIKKVMDIMRWSKDNIMCKIPEGLKVMDDHPLNIIIRQYGAKEQVEDIFTLLCSYAGFRAGMAKCNNSDKTRRITLSFVRVDGRWLIFNAARSKYFLNKEGKVGSVRDYLKGDIVLSDEDRAYYSEYLSDLENVDLSTFIRTEEQMPFRRPLIQFRKILNPKKFSKNK